jgi:hypothetical protein
VKGVGGHGAAPHTTKDPIVLGSRIVTALQTLVSRELDPQDPAVVTVGSFQAGAKHNIISDEAKLLLTVRSYTPEVRKMLLDGIPDRARRGDRGRHAGRPMPVVTVREAEYTPATVNTDPHHRAPPRCSPALRRGAVSRRDAAGDGRRGFQPLLARRQAIESLIFWVGGVPKAQVGKAGAIPPSSPRSTAPSGRRTRSRPSPPPPKLQPGPADPQPHLDPDPGQPRHPPDLGSADHRARGASRS